MKDNKDKIERRTSQIDSFDAEKNTVEGYALVFDTPSTNLSFTEVIARSSITEDTLKNSDVFCVIDHDRSKGVLARSRYGEGSLNLTLDDKGLKYQFSLPQTEIGNQLRSYLERGEITSSSFAFTVTSDEWTNNEGNYVRNINTIDRVYDVSPVFNAAYDGTEVALRSLDELKQKETELANAKIEELKLQALEEQRKADNIRKIRNMRNKLNIR